MSGLFRAMGVPLTMVVESGGRVSYVLRGQFSTAALVDSVIHLLEQPAESSVAASISVTSVATEDAVDR